VIGLRYALGSDVGKVRTGNEDAAYAGPHFVAVADGVGGNVAGEIASRAVIAVMSRLDGQTPGSDLLSALQSAVDDAHARLAELIAEQPALRGMSTTLTALLVSEGRLGLVHVGDSRGYLLRDSQLGQITHDHSFVQGLVDAGEITQEEAVHHPRRSLILRALDGINPVEVDLRLREARVGDRYLLCSDGLSDFTTAPTIAEALELPDPQAAADRLVDLALRAGGPDNITVAVVDIVDDSQDAVISGEPIVAGSASFAERTSTRAAREPRPGREPRGRHGRERGRLRPGIVVALLLVVLLGGGYVGLRVWLATQWYVGVADEHVSVFQGVPGSVVGIGLHSRHDLLQPLADVVEADRERVSDGITARSHADARRIATSLGGVTPTTAPTTAPTAAPSTAAPAASPAPPVSGAPPSPGPAPTP
jgi:serine/threonine protein phosphatase PrpC